MNIPLLRTVLRQWVELIIAELDRQHIAPAPPEIANTIMEVGKIIATIDAYERRKQKPALTSSQCFRSPLR